MKALVYHGPGKIALEEKQKPTVHEPTDAVVKVTYTTICGTDLHIMKGDVASVADGRTLGHEGVGVIEDAGAGVSNFRRGDKVLISCITSCGECGYCREECIPIASTAAGFSEIRSMGHRQSMSEYPMPIRACTMFRTAPTWKLW